MAAGHSELDVEDVGCGGCVCRGSCQKEVLYTLGRGGIDDLTRNKTRPG